MTEKDVQICGISEHWLYSHDLHFLNSIHHSYNGFGKSDGTLSLPSNRRVGKGGVALIWHTSLNEHVTPLNVDSDRIVGVQFQASKNNFWYIFQVYLPCTNHPVQFYRDCINALHDIVSAYTEKGRVVVMGDFNTHLLGRVWLRDNDRRSRDLVYFMEQHNLVAVDTLSNCTGAVSTFVSYDGRYESLIDHVFLSGESCDLVRSCCIVEDDCLNVSSHRPIICSLCIPAITDKHDNPVFKPIKWKKLKQDDAVKYSTMLSCLLASEIDLRNFYVCRENIDLLYNTIVKSISSASKTYLPYKSYRSYLKPYWNQSLKDLHALMRFKRSEWVADGKPHSMTAGSFLNYKDAKREFRAYHRKRVTNYLREVHDEIDNAAGVDCGLFWRLFNARKNDRLLKAGCEIKFDGITVRDSENIAHAWGNYFSELYSDTEHDRFDQGFFEEITKKMSSIRKSDVVISENIADANCVAELTLKLKRNKMCGLDSVYNEHIQFGGETLCYYLTELFNMMFKLSYVPIDLKKGIIVTLHKGGGKPKDDPKNYRAITLSSCILKLYESVLLKVIKCNLPTAIHSLQGGFQKNVGCIMTSVLLREAVAYSRECGSKLYACFLDARQAFDRVWHDGLFFKLHEYGLPLPLLLNVIELHSNMNSCVLHKGYMSDWFPVLQGTRQGGICSPFLYLCFINDLIVKLENLNVGFSICNSSYCAPTVADDMLLLSLSRKSLQIMLDECNRYSCLWRYLYNPSKCGVLIFNDKYPEKQNNSNCSYMLGTAQLPCVENYKHLGILCERNSSANSLVKECCNKMRGTFFSLTNVGFHDDGLQPSTCKRIYNAVVLTKALYGCECWPALSKGQMLTLERSHRLCLKYIQGLNIRTSTDCVMSMLDCLPLEMEIEYRKLNLFGQLCRLGLDCAVKTMFLYRLSSYMLGKVSTGFVYDVGRILTKYDLTQFMLTYISDGSFPSKYEWKRTVRKVIRNRYVLEWNIRTSLDKYRRFRSVQCHYQLCYLWSFSELYPSTLVYVKSVAQLVTYLVRYDDVCHLCTHSCGRCNFADHLILDCSKTSSIRLSFFNCICDVFGPRALECFAGLDRSEFVNTILGVYHPAIEASLPDGKCFHDILKICFKHVHFVRTLSRLSNDTVI